VLKYAVIIHFISLFFAFIFAQGERKLLATATRRLGPSMSYANGSLQAIPDLLKFLTKTVNLSFKVNRTYFNLAAVYCLVCGYFVWFIRAFGFSGSNFLNFEYSFFFFLFVTIINVYALILGGFISLSKYAILSSIRVVGQLFSFDILQNILMCIVIAIFGTFSFEEITVLQEKIKIFLPIYLAPLALIGFLALLLENFRAPFDLAEAEAEIITGYTTEYYGFLFFAFLFSEFLSLRNGIIFFNQIFLGGAAFSFFFI
jgi:NADH-quinone oxidoreductase subunit H